MADPRIYKSFSTTSDKANDNGHIYDRDVIIEDIRTLLRTRKGDYPMQNDIGNVAFNYLFNPKLNEADKQDIIGDTEEQLDRDPRLSDVSVSVVESKIHEYFIVINAILLPLNEEINLEINLSE